MIGKLDKEIIEKFIEFQEKTGKHRELYIEDVEFEEQALKYVANFPAMTRISGGIDKTIADYESLPDDEKKNYKPLISGTVENNQISGYVHIDKLSENSLSKENVISWTRINSEIFFIQENPVCTNDDSFIMEVKESYIVRYVQLASMVSMKYKQFNWGNKAGKTKVKEVQIPIPKDLNKFYSSYQIQEAIVEFLEYSIENIERIRQRIDERYSIFERLKKALIPSTFKKDYVKVAFGRYAKEKGIEFSITDVEFQISSFDKYLSIQKGKSTYTSKYIKNNKGKYPVYSSNTNSKTKGLMGEINSYDYNEKSIQFTANGEKAGTIFKLDKHKFSMNGDRGMFILKENTIYLDYIYYNIKNEFLKHNFSWANKPTNTKIKEKIKIFIPKDLKDYTSLEIQKIIADFIEYTENRLQKEFGRMDTAYYNLNRLHNTYLGRTFRLIDWGGKS